MFTRDEFEEVLGSHAGVRREEVHAEARLLDDLGLDSFTLLELVAALADLGIDLGEDDWLRPGTVGELYDRCLEGLGRSAGSGLQAPAGQTTSFVPGAAPAAGARPVARGGCAPAAPATWDDPSAPTLTGRFFRLGPVLPPVLPFLYDLAIAPDVGFRWRYRGSIPSYQQFESELWQGLLVQLVVESVRTGQPVGHVVCYNPDFALGHAYVGAVMAGRYQRSGIAAEPVQLFTRYVFDVWPLRKLYFELPEFNYAQFASAAGRVLHVEGRLREHDYYQGRRWDRLILAMYRPGEDPVTEPDDSSVRASTPVTT